MDDDFESLVTQWLTLPALAELLGIDVTAARQLLRDRQLLAVRRGERSILSVPADLVLDGEILPGLPGTLSVLADAGFSDVESLRWLLTSDDSLPGSPVDALREGRKTEIRRRAQALAF